MIKNFLKNKMINNSIWIISERIVQMLLSLIVGSLSARYLGPSNYGLINYGASIVTFFTSFSKLGLDGIIVKEYINNSKSNGEIVGTALLMRLISSCLSIIMIFVTVLILKPGSKLVLFITLLQSVSLIFQSYEIIDLWFQSKLKSKYTSIAKIIAYITVSSYRIMLLITSKSVIWFAATTTLDCFIIMICLLIFYLKNNGDRFSFSFKLAKNLLKESYHFILSGLIVTLYTQIDKIMIGNMIDEKQVGLYSAATTICVLWGFIPEAIINSFRPNIYALKGKDNNKYLSRLKLLYCIIFYIGIFMCFCISLFSKYIILILYGEEYLLAQTSLLIAVWYTTFAYLGSARSVWIISEKKHKYVKKYLFIGSVVNIFLNYILIPIYGIIGAAAATLVSQFIVAIIAPLFYKETKDSTKYILEAMLFKGVG